MECLRKLWVRLSRFFCKKDVGDLAEPLKEQDEFAVTTIEGQNNFADILAWFNNKKSENVYDDEFFVADFRSLGDQLGLSSRMKEQLSKPCALLVGVFHKKDNSIEAEVFQCDALDAETKEALGNEKLVLID